MLAETQFHKVAGGLRFEGPLQIGFPVIQILVLPDSEGADNLAENLTPRMPLLQAGSPPTETRVVLLLQILRPPTYRGPHRLKKHETLVLLKQIRTIPRTSVAVMAGRGRALQ